MKNFLEDLFWIEAQIRLAHWQEKRGFHHEHLGNFQSELSEKFDLLVETFIGSNGNVAPLISESMFVLINNIDVSETMIPRIKKVTTGWELIKGFEIPSIKNVLDDIQTIIDKYTYLLGRV